MNLVEYLTANKPTLTIEQVHVPEWGEMAEKVYVRCLTTAELIAVGRVEAELEDNFSASLPIIAASVCNDIGELYFEHSHMEFLMQQPAIVIARFMKVIRQINALDDINALSAEDIEKN